MKIWKTTYKENEDSEDKTPGDGWCGYLAIDQIRRGNEDSRMIQSQEEANSLSQTIDELISFGTGSVRKGWRKLNSSKLTHREVLLSVRDTLRNWGSRLYNGIERTRWMSSKNLYGTCKKWEYSLWGEDPGDSGYCELRDSTTSQGFKNTYENWKGIMGGRMIVGTRNHYYVRSGGLLGSFEEAFQEVFQKATEHVWRHNVNFPLTLVNGRENVSVIGAVGAIPEENSGILGEKKDAPGPCESDNMQSEDIAEEIIASKKCGNLKVVFWNSNGWEQERCNRVAEVAFEEDADVICITDARMDSNREAKSKAMKGSSIR